MLHLIKHSERRGQGERRQFVEGSSRSSVHPTLFRSLLGRSLLGGILLGLIPSPLPTLLPTLLSHLEAQALPNRMRRSPDYPATVPNQVPQTPQAPAAPQTAAPSLPAAATTAPAATPAPAAPSLPPSMLDQPAQPAQIQFSANALSIHADNSSLGAILRDISAKSGMQLQGLNADERVFGSFGPGSPREVLANLLNGTPYDLLMLGDLSNGAPRQLILSPSTPGGPTPPSPQDPSSTDDDVPNNTPPPPPPEPGQRREIVPGMNPQTVKTPQQMLQELQQMRGEQPPPQQPQ